MYNSNNLLIDIFIYRKLINCVPGIKETSCFNNLNIRIITIGIGQLSIYRKLINCKCELNYNLNFTNFRKINKILDL